MEMLCNTYSHCINYIVKVFLHFGVKKIRCIQKWVSEVLKLRRVLMPNSGGNRSLKKTYCDWHFLTEAIRMHTVFWHSMNVAARVAQILKILEITCSQAFIAFGYDQKLLWFFSEFFVHVLIGYARVRENWRFWTKSEKKSARILLLLYSISPE